MASPPASVQVVTRSRSSSKLTSEGIALLSSLSACDRDAGQQLEPGALRVVDHVGQAVLTRLGVAGHAQRAAARIALPRVQDLGDLDARCVVRDGRPRVSLALLELAADAERE